MSSIKEKIDKKVRALEGINTAGYPEFNIVNRDTKPIVLLTNSGKKLRFGYKEFELLKLLASTPLTRGDSARFLGKRENTVMEQRHSIIVQINGILEQGQKIRDTTGVISALVKLGALRYRPKIEG